MMVETTPGLGGNLKEAILMGKLLLTGVDGNLGRQAAEYLLELEPVDNLIFCGYSVYISPL